MTVLAAAWADPMQTDNVDVSPWDVALEENTADEMLEIFDIDLDVQDEAGQTYLHRAILEGIVEKDTDEAEMFIKADADLNIVSNAGDTPLHIALDNSDIENFYADRMLRIVLNADPDASTPDATGRLPVFKWLNNLGGNVTWTQALSDGVPFSDEQTSQPQDSLDRFNQIKLENYSEAAFDGEAVAKITPLLANLADLSVRDTNGKSLLFTALDNGHNPGVIVHMLSCSANPYDLNDEGLTALSKAIEMGANLTAVAILAAGIDADVECAHRCITWRRAAMR